MRLYHCPSCKNAIFVDNRDDVVLCGRCGKSLKLTRKHRDVIKSDTAKTAKQNAQTLPIPEVAAKTSASWMPTQLTVKPITQRQLLLATGLVSVLLLLILYSLNTHSTIIIERTMPTTKSEQSRPTPESSPRVFSTKFSASIQPEQPRPNVQPEISDEAFTRAFFDQMLKQQGINGVEGLQGLAQEGMHQQQLQQQRQAEAFSRAIEQSRMCQACNGKGSYTFVDGSGRLQMSTCPYCNGLPKGLWSR